MITLRSVSLVYVLIYGRRKKEVITPVELLIVVTNRAPSMLNEHIIISV